MGIKVPALATGEEFIAGRSRDKAKELLELADAAGLKGSVRTTYNGYIVPSAIFAGSTPEEALIGGTLADDTEPVPAVDAAEADTDENPEDEPAAVQFDPSAATVGEVKEYLGGADDTERERVLAAEVEGKGRKSILDLATIPEGAK